MNSINRLIILFGLFIVSACTPKKESSEQLQEEPSASITLEVAGPSVDFPDAAISSMDYQKGRFTFRLSGDYKLGEQSSDAAQKTCANSAEGQHIHLIVNNGPYLAKYTEEFDHTIENGEHYLLAFLSRSYHESIKHPKASALIKAEIKDSSFKKIEPVYQPMLFYSRPKGAYVGNDTKEILLDFYIANCVLGEQFKVKADINGTEFIIDKWQAYIIKGLPMGENTIKLSLIDHTGALVNSALNPVERKFELQAGPGQ